MLVDVVTETNRCRTKTRPILLICGIAIAKVVVRWDVGEYGNIVASVTISGHQTGLRLAGCALGESGSVRHFEVLVEEVLIVCTISKAFLAIELTESTKPSKCLSFLHSLCS